MKRIQSLMKLNKNDSSVNMVDDQYINVYIQISNIYNHIQWF